MKTIAAIVLLSCCALAQDKTAISAAEASCGPQDKTFEVNSDESQHPTPTPDEGKAVIYFIADGHPTSVFGVDAKWVGGPSTVAVISSCQSNPVNTICARGGKTLFHREPELAFTIQAL